MTTVAQPRSNANTPAAPALSRAAARLLRRIARRISEVIYCHSGAVISTAADQDSLHELTGAEFVDTDLCAHCDCATAIVLTKAGRAELVRLATAGGVS